MVVFPYITTLLSHFSLLAKNHYCAMVQTLFSFIPSVNVLSTFHLISMYLFEDRMRPGFDLRTFQILDLKKMAHTIWLKISLFSKYGIRI